MEVSGEAMVYSFLVPNREDYFLAELQEHLTENEAARVFKTIIDWGRYAEIFAYDYDSGMLSLENPK